MIASDVPALLKYTRTVYYIDNLEIARLTPDSIEFFNIDKEPIAREATTIEWDAERRRKGRLRALHDEGDPRAALRCPRYALPAPQDGQIDLSELALDEEAIRNVHRIYIIGCGSAYHVGMAARYVFEAWPASPWRSMWPASSATATPCSSRTPAVVISQSGETADTLAALRLCKERGVRTSAS